MPGRTKFQTSAPLSHVYAEMRSGHVVDLTRLFARIPDDIVLAVTSDDLQLDDGQRCLVAWIAREQVASAMNGGTIPADFGHALTAADVLDPEHDVGFSVVSQAHESFGGSRQEWLDVFYGVCHWETLPTIEVAWMQRIDEAVRHLTVKDAMSTYQRLHRQAHRRSK